MLNEMPLTDELMLIINRYRAAGHTANIVGGAVRDFLLGRPSGDYDITTSATPDETKEIFCDQHIIETGIKHGTVTILINGVPFEVTTYRSDGEYLDNRHPASVSYTSSLEDDLARRDFTVNAICYNPYDGYTDLYGGRQDLRDGLIRAVGDPETRFREDALRIIRALRFASVLGFEIESATAEAVRRTKELLHNVSCERIYAEWIKLLSGKNAYAVLEKYSDVIAEAVPGLSNLRLPDRTLFDRADTMTRQQAIYLLSCSDAAGSFDLAMRSLHTDNSTRLHGYAILSSYSYVSFANERELCHSLYRYGYETVLGVLKLGALMGEYTELEHSLLDSVIERGLPYRISDLAIRGGDVKSLGAVGTEIGELLDAAIVAVIDGICENDRNDLLAFLSDRIG